MQNAPQGVHYSENEHCYTIDGDADRSLFFFFQVVYSTQLNSFVGMFCPVSPALHFHFVVLPVRRAIFCRDIILDNS